MYNIYIYSYAYMLIYMHVCMYVRMSVYASVYTYTDWKVLRGPDAAAGEPPLASLAVMFTPRSFCYGFPASPLYYLPPWRGSIEGGGRGCRESRE